MNGGLPRLRVERARLRVVELPLVSPFTTSFGTQTVRRALLVEVEGDGVAGVGECVAGIDPAYSSETCAGALSTLRDHILPSVLGAPPADVAGHARSWEWVRGHHMAKAATEMALLDQAGHATGQSVSQILGGVRSRIGCGVSIGIQSSLAATLTAIEGYLAAGYQRIKLKCKPGYDVELAQAVRQRFPGTPLMLDANSAYSLQDVDQLRALDEFDLTMIEQPLAHDDLIDHATLQAQIETSICLDESVESLADLRAAIALGSGRILNIKAGRAGRFGAAGCWRPGSDALPTWRWPRCPASTSRATPRPAIAISRRTCWSSRSSLPPTAPCRCRPGPGSGSRWSSAAWTRRPSTWRS